MDKQGQLIVKSRCYNSYLNRVDLTGYPSGKVLKTPVNQGL